MDENKTELLICAHAFADQSPQNLLNVVNKFGKDKKNVTVVFNSTAVMIPLPSNGRIIMGQASVAMQIICTAFVTWEDTQENYNNFQTQLKLQLPKLS